MRTTSLVASGAGLLAIALLTAGSQASAAERPKRIITKPQFDPDARKVELFEAMEAGEVEVKLIARDSTGGNVLIENKTGEPLSVQLPEAFVGVQVFKQIGGIGPGGGLTGLGGTTGVGLTGQTGYGAAAGIAQPFGGGMGMMGMGMGMPGMMGMGFYSIPPESVARIPYRSVCLAHGKPEPSPNKTYQMVRVESFTNDPVLAQLITLLNDPKIDQHALQAATWHITDGMSWQQLAAKRADELGIAPRPYFSPAHLQFAQQTFVIAQQKAAEVERKKSEAQSQQPATSPAPRQDLPGVRQPLPETTGSTR